MSLTIELSGLELHGHHGAEARERETGQRFLFDLWLEAPDVAGATDRLEDTIDYRRVVDVIAEVSEGRGFHLLEGLATAVADALLERFPLTAVHLRVRKPDVHLGRPVEHAAVTVTRRRP
jgi:7,8-dihydroneopterin aldolase/epimerase/oxygenase